MGSYNAVKCPHCQSERLGELTTTADYDFANSKIIFDEKNLPKRNNMGYFQFTFCIECKNVVKQ
jgi:ribosomal protein S27E